MSVLQRKIEHFLTTKNDLEAEYKLIVKSQPHDDSETGLKDLYEFDQLCYLYIALKSYYDYSQTTWDLDYRNILDDLASIVQKMEDKIPIAEIVGNVPQLNVIRRQLRENAKEGGKVASSMVQSTADMETFNAVIASCNSQHVNETETMSRQLPKNKPRTPQRVTDKSSTTKISQHSENRHGLPSRDSDSKIASVSTSPTPDSGSSNPSESGKPPSNIAAQNIYELSTSENDEQPDSGTTKPTETHTSNGLKRGAPQVTSHSQKRIKQVFFTHLDSWKPEYVRVLYQVAMINPHRINQSVQEAFREKFNISLSYDAVHALLFHYGILSESMEHYQYYIQTFHSVASKFYVNRHKYVTEPWAELKKLFTRKTDYTLSDEEVKGLYELFVLHRQTYGPTGEPPAYYEPLWEDFNRIHKFRKYNKLNIPTISKAKESKPNDAATNYQPAQFSTDEHHRSINHSTNWTPAMNDAIIRADAAVGEGSGRELLIQQKLRQEGFSVSLEDIGIKLGNAAVVESAKVLKQRIRETMHHFPQPSRQLLSRELTDQFGNQTPQPNPNQAGASRPALSSIPPSTGNQAQSGNATSTAHKSTNSSVAEASKTPSKSLPQGVKRVAPRTGDQSKHFDGFMEQIAKSARPEWHYHKRFDKLPASSFWDFEKNKTITTVVDHISLIPENTLNATERVARANLMKLITLRFLRLHQIMISEDYLQARLIKMMEKDVFDPKACRLINDQLTKK